MNGKDSTITNWTPLRGQNDRLEVVVLIDSSARTSIGTQLNEVARLCKEPPAGGPGVDRVDGEWDGAAGHARLRRTTSRP